MLMIILSRHYCGIFAVLIKKIKVRKTKKVTSKKSSTIYFEESKIIFKDEPDLTVD